MKNAVLLIAAVTFIFQQSAFGIDANSVTNFTGSRTKLVWFDGSGSNQVVKYFDTDEGTERAIGTGFTPLSQTWNQGQIRITRSGKWVTVADLTETYIIDISGTEPNQRILLDNTDCDYWCVKAFGLDVSTGTDWAYALENFDADMLAYRGTALYKFPLKDDGTADLTKAEQIIINSTDPIDGSIAVSANGEKIACLVPWSQNPSILDVATGDLEIRLYGPGACHTNIAPDNSYRFFHLDDDHVGCYMWGENMDYNSTYISFGFTGENWGPRWTNNVRFLASNKAGEGFEPGSFVLQKFSADFTSIESSLTIGSGWGGEAWLESGITTDPTGTRPAGSSTGSIQNELSFRISGNMLYISNAPGFNIVLIADAQGRAVYQGAVSGAHAVDIKNFGPGAYIISACSDIGRISKLLQIR